MKNLLENIKKHEGFRERAYTDTLGFLTVGYGFKVNALTIDEVALNGGRIEPMNKEVAYKILELKLQKLEATLKERAPHIFTLKPSAQEACFEMAYQLGVNGFLKFKEMNKALKMGLYHKAHKEALSSNWAIQTPKRAQEVANGFIA